MSALVPLHFAAADVRMVIIDGVPWWVLNDVCAILEIANPRNVARRLRDWQKGVHAMDTLGGRQETVIVNEAGIYKVVLGSNKPIAEEFERWLTTEVLPSIRKWGCYPPPAVEPLPLHEQHQAHEGSTPAARLLEECARIAQAIGLPSGDDLARELMSRNRLVAMKRGDGSVIQLCKDEDTLRALLGMGFDLRYILNGSRAFTLQELRAVGQLRADRAERRLLPEG